MNIKINFIIKLNIYLEKLYQKVTENLELIDEKTHKHMNGHLNTLFSHINSSFILQINIEGINETLHLIVNNIFVNPINLRIEMYNY